MPAADEPMPLFAHSKRPRWGFAILAREEREQRHYQFQDGQLRTFKEGYYELLELVEPPRALDIVRDLKAMLRVAQREAGTRTKERVTGFETRLSGFLAAFPAGFADPGWIVQRRQGPKRRKQHRDPAISDARERLSAAAIDAAIEAARFDTVCDAVRAVLGATDLAGSKDTGSLRRLAPGDQEPFARALRALLWSEDDYGERFERYVEVLGRTEGERVTWPLASALPALVHPSEHAFVKPSVVRREAQWSQPSLPYDAAPSAELYARMRAMIDAVKGRLERAGHTPRDLFDVTDFMALPRSRPASGEESGSR